MSDLVSSTPAWHALEQQAAALSRVHLRDLFAQDAHRWRSFHLEADGWLLDYSRQRVTAENLGSLLELARAASLTDRIAAMAAGFRPVTLGPRVLRAETAPLAVLALLSDG